jgi:hypothetical protein
MKRLLVIGGDRLGNFETMAPIVHQFKFKHNFSIMTLLQSEKVFLNLSRNKFLDLLYSSGRVIILRRFFSVLQIIEVIRYVFGHKNGFVLTNRALISPKFKLLRLLLRLNGWRVLYTMSFSRGPTKNIRFLMSPKSVSLCKRELADFCLIPTREHMIDYGIVGYRSKHMLVTGYPKLWDSWVQFIEKNSSSNHKFDYLVIMGIYHQRYNKILLEIFHAIELSHPGASISIKPHPTTSFVQVQKIINKTNSEKLKISINENNVAIQSMLSKITIAHGTSACIDASIGSTVINYWGEKKSVVDNYLNKSYDDRKSFEIFESLRTCNEFVIAECYEVKDLKSSIEDCHYAKENRGMVMDVNYECDLLEEIDQKKINSVIN